MSKDPHAVALGRQRQAGLTPAERSALGRRAANARWARERARLAQAMVEPLAEEAVRPAIDELVGAGTAPPPADPLGLAKHIFAERMTREQRLDLARHLFTELVATDRPALERLLQGENGAK